jgi:hypothetical protein
MLQAPALLPALTVEFPMSLSNSANPFTRAFTSLLVLGVCTFTLQAQNGVQIIIESHAGGKIHHTRQYQLNLKGTVTAQRGLATMYTVDGQGNRGEVAFQALA